MAIVTTQSIAKRTAAITDQRTALELRQALNAAQADLAALRAAIIGITAKLDADAGVTDTNYGALWNPAALKLIP
jgi:hypothetical protein